MARVGSRFSPGVLEVLDTVQDRSDEWHQRSVASLHGSGPLWVALGDSTAQGIGASSIDKGYVGQLGHRLAEQDRHHDIVNLARTGARIDDVLERQLHLLHGLPRRPALVTCAVGSNDVMRVDSVFLVTQRMRTLLARLGRSEARVVIATVPQGRNSYFARRLNTVIRDQAPRHGLAVADVARTLRGPWAEKLAVDRFHPNDNGYADWTEAFAAPLGLDSTR